MGVHKPRVSLVASGINEPGCSPTTCVLMFVYQHDRNMVWLQDLAYYCFSHIFVLFISVVDGLGDSRLPTQVSEPHLQRIFCKDDLCAWLSKSVHYVLITSVLYSD